MKKYLLTIIVFVVSFAFSSGQVNPQTALFINADNDHFVQTSIGGGLYTQTATFNMDIFSTSTTAFITMGLPTAALPAFSTANISLFQNGGAASIFSAVSVSYGLPFGDLTPNVDGTTWTIDPRGETVFPLTVTFVGNSLTGYGVRLDSVTWTENGQEYTTLLGSVPPYGDNVSPFFLVGEGPSAIPEPSTYALLLGISGLGLVMMRRSRQHQKRES